MKKVGVPHTTAKYDGHCPQCKNGINENDPIYRHDDQWICKTCIVTALPNTDITITDRNDTWTDDWWNNPTHKPHPISEPCTKCRQLDHNTKKELQTTRSQRT